MHCGQGDPRLSAMMNIDQPNRWQLLSLLIDTPVDQRVEEHLLLSLSGVERVGIKFLRHMQQVL